MCWVIYQHLLLKNLNKNDGKKILVTNGPNHRAKIAAFKKCSKKERANYILIAGHNANDLIEYTSDDCVVMTILRDPVDRMISHYKHAITHQHELNDVARSCDITNINFIGSKFELTQRNWLVRHFSGLKEIKDEQKALDLALHNIKRYDVVGQSTNLRDAFDKLNSLIDRKIKFWEVRANPTRRKISVPQNVKDGIADSNSLDIRILQNSSRKPLMIFYQGILYIVQISLGVHRSPLLPCGICP